jgi:hypothetical protein
VVKRTRFIAHAKGAERYEDRLNQVGGDASAIGTAAPEAAEERERDLEINRHHFTF